MINFRLADTFSDSLIKLTGQEQKAVKTTVFDMQMDHTRPSLKFHRIEKGRDPNFWSVRASDELRVIVHKTDSDFLVCYVDHHDAAYAWAMKRKITQHPRTGAMQVVELEHKIVEIPEYRQVEVEVPAEKPVAVSSQPLFAGVSDEDLLSYGVPEDWLAEVAQITEDGLLDLAERLPQEAAEALLELAVGNTPEPAPTPETGSGTGFDHADSQRRFRLITDHDELAMALEYPWEKWTIFLHPSQKSAVESNYHGPARATGSAGTGKTIVALHRTAFLAKANPKARILLTTFSQALAELLEIKLNRLVGENSDVRKRIELRSLPTLVKDWAGDFTEPSTEELAAWIEEVLESTPEQSFPLRFVRDEWNHLFDAYQIADLESYLGASRRGRGTRLVASQRTAMFAIMEKIRAHIRNAEKRTMAEVYDQLSKEYANTYDHVIVDEAQDLSVAALKFLSSIAKDGDNNLYFAGDTGQRIFQLPFSWSSLGIQIRGRSTTLRVNYRTSHQIRSRADTLLDETVTDGDGNEESRLGVVSVFSGPVPKCFVAESQDEEIAHVVDQLFELRARDFAPEQIGIFVRSNTQMARARAALKQAGMKWDELENTRHPSNDRISLSTMHLAKGLEYRSVIIMACDDDIMPLEERIEKAQDQDALEEVYNTERHLLYVACTRAREELLITAVAPESEFLVDSFEEELA